MEVCHLNRSQAFRSSIQRLLDIPYYVKTDKQLANLCYLLVYKRGASGVEAWASTPRQLANAILKLRA